MSDQFLVHPLPNGLTLLCEKMAGVRSAAMSLLIPAGAASDPDGAVGCANILSELVLRGAGTRDSRTLTDHLDRLGLQRSSSSGLLHTRLACAAPAQKVMEGLPVYADVARRPQLPEAGFVAARELALQGLSGLDDDPRSKLFIKLRETFWPDPLGRNSMGNEADMEQLTHRVTADEYRRRYQPDGAILSIAGDIDFVRVTQEVERLFGDWSAGERFVLQTRPSADQCRFLEQQSEQTHIGIAYAAPSEKHPSYYAARLAVEVLSGGMSGRLFTEIREKKGLCYSVSASYSSLPGLAAIMGYAGTSNERAQQTLDGFIIELDRLTAGVTAGELDRAKIGLKAATVMSGESTSSRAGAIAHDFYMRGRIRTLGEILGAIDAVDLEQINAYLAANPPGPYTIALVGPKELTVPA